LNTIFGYSYNLVTRDFMFNIGGLGSLTFLITAFLFIVSILLAGDELFCTFKIFIKEPFPVKHTHKKDRLRLLLKYGFLQKKPLYSKYSAFMHLLITIAVLGMLFIFFLLIIQVGIVELIFKKNFIIGYPYIVFTFLEDFFLLLFLIAIFLAFYRRVIIKPENLKTSGLDRMFLLFLTIIILSIITDKALRIAITGSPEFEIPAFISYNAAGILSTISNVFGTEFMVVWHYINWWFSLLLCLLFITGMMFGKSKHIINSLISIYTGNPENENPSQKFIIPMYNKSQLNTGNYFGKNEITDFTSRDFIEIESCVYCGKCSDFCPALLSEMPLSPQEVMRNLKKCLTGSIVNNKKMMSNDVIDDYVEPEAIWSCSSCGNCAEICPVSINPMQKLNDMKKFLVMMKADIPAPVTEMFYNYEKSGNIYAMPNSQRFKWLTKFPDIKLSPLDDCDYLFFAGCTVSYNARLHEQTANMLRLLINSGLKIAVLDTEEFCCGSYFLQHGNDYLYNAALEKNLQVFNKYNVKKIITSCPHCWNVLNKEYKQSIAKIAEQENRETTPSYEVYHIMEIIINLKNHAKLTFANDDYRTIVYHDPCFLSKYNNLYNQPREILLSMPNTRMTEMNYAKSASFCCGNKNLNLLKRQTLQMNDLRAKQAQSTGAEILLTACPDCFLNLSDSIERLQLTNIKAIDFTDFLYTKQKKC